MKRRGKNNGFCFACKKHKSLEKHHRKFISRGGSDDPVNIDWLCWWEGCHDTVHQQPHIPWTRKFRTFEWQAEGQTEHDCFIEHPEWYLTCFEAEQSMGYSKARQLGRKH